MMAYASRTGTRRNLAALRKAGWGLLVSRAGEWRREGFDLWCVDNGAWSDFRAGRSFDEDKFEKFLQWVETQPPAQFIILPDIVAGGLESLHLSVRYLNRCGSVCRLVLIAVQDGMEHKHLAPFVGKSVGIFMGGSTKWKLAMMGSWGEFCRAHGCHYHVARVNTAKRFAQAHASFADSVDGSSASRYAVTLPMLNNARRQGDLFAITQSCKVGLDAQK